MAMLGNPFADFASRFRSQMQAPMAMQSQMPAQQMPMHGGGLFGGGFMPTVSPFTSAISRPTPTSLQYNPMVQLSQIPRPDPFGFFTPKPQPAAQPVAPTPAQPTPGVALTPVEKSLLNVAMGRPQWQGIDTDKLTSKDYAELRRTKKVGQGVPLHRRGFGA